MMNTGVVQIFFYSDFSTSVASLEDGQGGQLTTLEFWPAKSLTPLGEFLTRPLYMFPYCLILFITFETLLGSRPGVISDKENGRKYHNTVASPMLCLKDESTHASRVLSLLMKC